MLLYMQEKPNVIEAIRFVVKDEIEPFREEFNQKIDKVLTGMDTVVKELQTIREEQIFSTHRQDEQERAIDVLDGRVTRLESQAIAG